MKPERRHQCLAMHFELLVAFLAMHFDNALEQKNVTVPPLKRGGPVSRRGGLLLICVDIFEFTSCRMSPLARDILVGLEGGIVNICRDD